MVTVTKYVWDLAFDCMSHELDENNVVKAEYHNTDACSAAICRILQPHSNAMRRRSLLVVVCFIVSIHVTNSTVGQDFARSSGRFVLETVHRSSIQAREVDATIVPTETNWSRRYPNSSGQSFLSGPSQGRDDGIVIFPRQVRGTEETQDYSAALSFLSDNPHLHSLEANFSDLAVEDVSAIASIVRLRRLSVIDCGRTLGDLSPLGQLEHLQFLDISDNSIGEAPLDWFAKLRELRHLGAAGTEIGDSECHSIAKCIELRQLQLHFTNVSDAGLEVLSELRHLSKLDVSATQVTDASADSLLECVSLKELHVNKCRITETFIGRIAVHPSIEAVFAVDSGLTEARAKEIRRRFPKLRLVIEIGYFGP